jgi:hypothetical protein
MTYIRHHMLEEWMRFGRRYGHTFLAVLAVCACASTRSGSASTSATDIPKSELERELDQKAPTEPLSIFGGEVTAEVEATGPIRFEEGRDGPDGKPALISVPIGTGVDLVCSFYPQVVPPAGLLARIVRELASTKAVARAQLTEVLAVGDVPVLSVEVEYSAEEGGRRRPGFQKLMLFADEAHPVLCFHDQIGYRSTFREITLDLARSLKSRTPPPPPRFSELQIVAAGEAPVGFLRRTIREAGGVRHSWKATARVLPKDGVLTCDDEGFGEEIDAQGRLSGATFVFVVDGDLRTRFTVKRLSDGQYSLDGVGHDGQEMGTRFQARTKGGLLASTGVAETVSAWLASGRAEDLTIEQYDPTLAFARAVDVTYRRLASREVTMKVDKIELREKLDDHGLTERTDQWIGRKYLTTRRVFVNGTP